MKATKAQLAVDIDFGKDIKPSWAKRMKPRMKIKDHIFY